MTILNHDTGIGKVARDLDHYFQTHLHKMEELIETVRSDEQVDEYKRLTGSVLLDGSGNGTIQLPSGQGYGQKLERITVLCPGATAGNVAIFANSVSPGTLLEVVNPTSLVIANIGQVVAYSDAFSNNLYVSDQEVITVQFSGFTAAVEGYVNIQSKIIRDPVHVHRRSSYFEGNP